MENLWHIEFVFSVTQVIGLSEDVAAQQNSVVLAGSSGPAVADDMFAAAASDDEEPSDEAARPLKRQRRSAEGTRCVHSLYTYFPLSSSLASSLTPMIVRTKASCFLLLFLFRECGLT